MRRGCRSGNGAAVPRGGTDVLLPVNGDARRSAEYKCLIAVRAVTCHLLFGSLERFNEATYNGGYVPMTATIPPSHKERLSSEGVVDFPRAGHRGVKPRRVGLTQIRGRYYNAAAHRRLADEFETLRSCVDSLECLRAGIWTSPPSWVDVENERSLP